MYGSFAIVWVAFPYDRPGRLNIFFETTGTIRTIIWKPGLRTPKCKMATPLDFLQGHVTVSKLALFHDTTCDLKQHFALDLFVTSFHSVAVGFAILCSQRWILVNINASMVTFIKI